MTEQLKCNLLSKIKDKLERPSTKKYKEIKKVYQECDESTEYGKQMKLYYGGYLDCFNYLRRLVVV